MLTQFDVHRQFAAFFGDVGFQPYAYLVSKRLHEGHICVDLDEVMNERAEMPPNLITSEIGPIVFTRWVSTSLEPVKPFVVHKDKIYLQFLFIFNSI